MTKTAKRVIAICAVIVGLVVAFISGYASRFIFVDDELKSAYYLLEKYKKYYYYDDGDIVTDIENALLDKYSQFYTKQEYEAMKQQAKGEMVGIGVQVTVGTTRISGIIGNSPCEKAGVKAGGNIVAVVKGETEIAINNFDEFASEIDAVPVNGEITFKVDYDLAGVKTYTVKRQKFITSYVTYVDSEICYGFSDSDGEMKATEKDKIATVVGDKTAYIKYDAFNGTNAGLEGSAGQIREVLRIFKERNRTKLILDLRSNGGGYMDILCDVASNFIGVENGARVAVSYAIDKNDYVQTFTSSKTCYYDYGFEKIVVMCDENTASASEALIGAMLDYDNDNIVSVVVSSSYSGLEKVYKTYGKGIMQTTYMNLDGSAVKLTTAQIYWPVSDTCIHNVGITKETSPKVINAERELAFLKALDLCNN